MSRLASRDFPAPQSIASRPPENWSPSSRAARPALVGSTPSGTVRQAAPDTSSRTRNLKDRAREYAASIPPNAQTERARQDEGWGGETGCARLDPCREQTIPISGRASPWRSPRPPCSAWRHRSRNSCDAGTGGQVQPTAGKMLANMAAAGIDPKKIDTILISHCHPDHRSSSTTLIVKSPSPMRPSMMKAPGRGHSGFAVTPGYPPCRATP